MKLLLAALIVVTLCATAVSATNALADDHYPVGDFIVTPSSGPIGTLVTVSGDFDREITRIRFTCVYYDRSVDGFDTAQTPSEPSQTFTFDYKIPAELDIRQPRVNVPTRPPLGDDCYFLAEAGHRLARASVQFTVTEATALPSAGLPPHSNSAVGGARSPIAILVVTGLVLVPMGWWYKRQSVSPS